MDKEGEEILQETIRMLTHEFHSASTSISMYLKHMPPIDPEAKYFRIRLMETVCRDLIEILQEKGNLSEETVKGAEMAIAIFRKAKRLGENPEFEDGR
jgi:hypothetical protein